MNHAAVRVWGFLLLAIVGVYGAWSAYKYANRDEASSSVYIGEPTPDGDGPLSAPLAPTSEKDLRFIERSGDEFKLSDMDGKLWIASFFFTSCPGECKILNNELAKLQHEYRDRDVTFVSFTCDPANDTLEELRKYANFYAADPKKWLFVRGSIDYTSFVGITRFKVSVVQKSHTDRMILIAPDGKIEDYFSAKQPSDMLKVRKTLDSLLAESRHTATSE
jgi:cytochrome oxidase Cu insertion factor (SCO1/SenC/PrrC family)